MIPVEVATLSRNSRSRFEGLTVQHNRWRVRLPRRPGGPHHWVLNVPLDETETVAVKDQRPGQDCSRAPPTPNSGGLGEVRTGPSTVPSDEHPAMISAIATKERRARRLIWASSDSLDRLSCEGRWFAAGDKPPGAGGDKG